MKLLNIFLFQATWFLSVYSIAKNYYILGLILCLSYLSFYIWVSKNKRKTLSLFGAATILGIFVDTLLVKMGIVSFLSTSLVPLLLWPLFASTLSYSLSFLRQRYILGMVLGFWGGGFSYSTASSLGAISLNQNFILSLSIIALIWSVALPFLQYLHTKIIGDEKAC